MKLAQISTINLFFPDQNPGHARFLSCTIARQDSCRDFEPWFTLNTYIYSMVHTISFATAHAHFSNELLLRIIQNGMIRKESDLCEFYNPSSLCHQI